MHRGLLRGSGHAGYGNDVSILGVPDVPTWLLRHDGMLLALLYCVGQPLRWSTLNRGSAMLCRSD